MIAALEEHANEDPNNSAIVKETAWYLKACHLMFENGILSHVFARSTESDVFKNMQEGWRYFVEWAGEHNKTAIYRGLFFSFNSLHKISLAGIFSRLQFRMTCLCPVIHTDRCIVTYI